MKRKSMKHSFVLSIGLSKKVVVFVLEKELENHSHISLANASVYYENDFCQELAAFENGLRMVCSYQRKISFSWVENGLRMDII